MLSTRLPEAAEFPMQASPHPMDVIPVARRGVPFGLPHVLVMAASPIPAAFLVSRVALAQTLQHVAPAQCARPSRPPAPDAVTPTLPMPPRADPAGAAQPSPR